MPPKAKDKAFFISPKGSDLQQLERISDILKTSKSCTIRCGFRSGQTLFVIWKKLAEDHSTLKSTVTFEDVHNEELGRTFTDVYVKFDI
jgi:hypothetical protein